jgi:hypothetical protein
MNVSTFWFQLRLIITIIISYVYDNGKIINDNQMYLIWLPF